MAKTSKKRKHSEVEDKVSTLNPLPAVRHSDEPIEKKVFYFSKCVTSRCKIMFQIKWVNKQRVLIFASRGISHRDRHLMEDLKKIMPHHKPEAKMERSKTLSVINEMCEMKNCSKAMMFEGRKKRDLYMWLSNVPNGPSAKFLIENGRILFPTNQIK